VLGKLVWKDNCLGATQAVQIIGTQLYIGSHSHDCTAVKGGFPQAPLKQGWHHLINEDTGTGTVQDWFPNTNAGPGNNVIYDVGPRSLGTDGKTLFVGGSFTTVNGQPQQGLTRFVPNSATPGQVRDAAPVAPIKPIVTSNEPGKILVKWTTSYDLDDGQLTYRLYRDGKIIQTFPNLDSRWWISPAKTYLDTTMTSGAHSYAVDAVDSFGKISPKSPSGGATVATVSNGGYDAAIAASTPQLFWKLDDAAGSTSAADSSGNGVTGLVQRGVTFGVPGVTPGTTAADVNDAIINVSTGNTPFPATYSMELWFKTTSATGGRLMGFSDGAGTADSAHSDPFLEMLPSGQLIFGMWDGLFTPDGIWGAGTYNDGTWHHVVISSNGTRLNMYIDNVVATTSPKTPVNPQTWDTSFRLGTDTFGYWPLPPITPGFTGSLADVAVYPRALTAAEILTHFRRNG